MPWDINVDFKQTLVFHALGRGDVLRFTLKDIALFQQEHFFGNFGPKTIDYCILKVEHDFEGYLEGYLGFPVLKVAARFSTTGWVADEPVPGEMTGPLEQQALASAPMLEPDTPGAAQVDQTDDAAPNLLKPSATQDVGMLGSAEMSGRADVGMLGSAEMPGRAESGPGASGSGASGSGDPPAPVLGASATSRAPVLGASATSSPFYIDPVVFNLAPANLLLQHLATMQDRQVKWPFPPGGLRNYNVFAVGWQPTNRDWDQVHLWGPIPGDFRPKFLEEVYTRLLELNRRGGEGRRDVGVLCTLLAHLKAALARVRRVRSICISKRARTWHATRARRAHDWCQAHVATGARSCRCC